MIDGIQYAELVRRGLLDPQKELAYYRVSIERMFIKMRRYGKTLRKKRHGQH